MIAPAVKRFWKWSGLILICMLVGLLAINSHILSMSKAYIVKDPAEAPPGQVAILLGARVYADGKLSAIVADRAKTAIELYEKKKVEKILVSGDHGRKNYDEVNAIKNFLLSHGIPARDIFLDHAGFDTYDSLYRAKAIFQVKSALIVTQEFHLPRAVYIGKSLGLELKGVPADRQKYVLASYNEFRETLARIKAFGEVLVRAKPKFLGQPIPVSGDGRASWDQL